MKDLDTFQGGSSLGSFISLIGDVYGTFIGTLGEICQNSLDSGGTNASIEIDLVKRSISGYDNGDGETSERFTKKLKKIGTTMKKDPGASGEKGYGLFAGIGILEKEKGKLVFISSTQRTSAFKFELLKKGLKESHNLKFELLKLDCKRLGSKNWRTLQQVKGFTKVSVSTLMKQENLAQYIADELATQYREKIRKTGMNIYISVKGKGKDSTAKVRPLKFPGKREDITINVTRGKRTETVTFEMYLTRNKHQAPKLMIDHSGKVEFPLKNLKIWSEIKNIMGSGHFQGSIHVDFCNITGPKTNFKEDPCLELLEEAILQLVINYATPWLAQLMDDKNEERIEKQLLNFIKSLDTFFKDNIELFPDELLAEVSEGHNDANKGKEAKKKIRTKPRKPRECDVPRMEKRPSKEQRDKNNRIHTGIDTPTGTKRRALRGETGLQLLRVEGDHKWMMKIGTQGPEKGKLLLNIRHPIYNEILDKGPKGQKEMGLYLELLGAKTVCIVTMSDEQAALFNMGFELFFMNYRSIMLN